MSIICLVSILNGQRAISLMIDATSAIAVISSVIAIIGVVATLITNIKAKKYIAITQAILDIPVEVMRGNIDGVRTDEDYINVGKAVYKVTDELDADKSVEVAYKV